MKVYEDYILTPVPWIEKIPSHWKLTRGKNLYQKMQRPTSGIDEVVTCFRDGTVTLRKNRRTTGFTESLKEAGYQGIRKGDLVIHVMDAFAGSIGVSDSDGKGTPVYSVCQSKGNSNNQYYALLLREMARAGFIQSLYRGIRERSSDFRFEVFAAQFYPVPPRPEQDQIVRFLDWKVASINRLITVRKRQIEEWTKLKKSIINNAVTKGLNTDICFKDSDVTWFDKMPEHWKIVKLKRVTTVRNEKNEYTPNSEDRYIGLENINSYSNDIRPTRSEYDASVQCVCRRGDLMFSKLRPYLAKVIIAPYDSYCTGELLIFSSFKGDIRFLRYVMLHEWFIDSVNSSTYGAKMPRANSDYILNMYVPLPSLDEQKEIVNYLDKKLLEIDNIIKKQLQIISNLYDLKLRLISDAVTGKIDVRSIEVSIFEYVEETANFSDKDNKDMGDASEDGEK